MGMAGSHNPRLIRRAVQLSQLALDQVMSSLAADTKRSTACTAPVDAEQSGFGDALQIGPRRIGGRERVQRIAEDAQVVEELRDAGIGAYQPEDGIGLPVEVGKASPYAGRALVVESGRQVDQAVVLVEPVVGAAVDVQHALHALQVQANAPLGLDRVGSEALGDQRRVLDWPRVGAPPASRRRAPERAPGDRRSRAGRPRRRRRAPSGPPRADQPRLRASGSARRLADRVARPTAASRLQHNCLVLSKCFILRRSRRIYRRSFAALRMRPAALRMRPAALRMKPAALRMRPAALRMRPAALRMRPAALRMRPAALRMRPAALRMRPAALRMKLDT